MGRDGRPRLRTVDKVEPPYKINQFGGDFPYRLAEEIVYLLATKGTATIEGPEWEQIFASCIGAKWKPSNVGLDDVVLGCCAWGAKTVKEKKPEKQEKVRLISGRNSPIYSFQVSKTVDIEADPLGEKILEIWNERVNAIRKKFPHLRTVVLMKGDDLRKVGVFEFETIRYEPELFKWTWNTRKNLEGFTKETDEHVFTWQPHGSQFTIIERVPKETIIIDIKMPKRLKKDAVLREVGFSRDWVKVRKRGG
jgi:hypothetical protein